MDSDCEGPPRAAIRQVTERMEDALLARAGVIGVDFGDGVVDHVLAVTRGPAWLVQTTSATAMTQVSRAMTTLHDGWLESGRDPSMRAAPGSSMCQVSNPATTRRSVPLGGAQ